LTLPLVLIPQYFGSLLFDRRTSRYLPFDAEATKFFRAWLKRPVGELIDEADDARAALGFVQGLEPLALMKMDGTLAADCLDVEPPVDHLLGPLATHVEVHAACNLACAHCFASPLPRGRDPLTLAELAGLFEELAAVGAFRLGLTGGEPLLRKDFFAVLDAAIQSGLHPCLTTNGYFIDEETARKFGEREMVWLNVSLDGASAATNDAVRGPGCFDRVMKSVEILREHTRFTLAFTLTRWSSGEAAEAVELAARVGAHTAVFRPLYPTGAALSRPELMPDFSQYQSALQTIGRTCPSEGGSPSARGIDPFSPQSRARTAGRVHPGHGCGAGTTVCSVSVEGRVNPCSFLGAAHEAGSIRERSFRSLWDEGFSFRKLRAEEDEAFRGGCRARSLALEGSVHARDPWEVAWRNGEGGAPGHNFEVDVE
jgi:radical SAM protein with 4Fe4S-binding SPASM domain